MGHIVKTDAGTYRANWRDPAGKQRAKTFLTKRAATAFLAEMETAKSRGAYVSPHAGRMLFCAYAESWLAARSTEITTAARDASVMRNHVVAQWGNWQLGKINHLAVQRWVVDLDERLSRWMVAKCLQLTSNVLRSAVRNRLIAFNPCDDVALPAIRRHEVGERIITRHEVRGRLLPAVPDRYRALVAVTAGTGLRWGEAVGLRMDAVDLDGRMVRVVRTVVEVAGHTSFKAYPKSRAGIRTVPLPGWAVTPLREHLQRYPVKQGGLLFTNEAGTALRRTLFRSRIWRPSLVRAGLLGQVIEHGGELFEAVWTNTVGARSSEQFTTYRAAVAQVARHQSGGLRFHDLRHSYGTWLADDGVPVNKVQRVMGHEKVTTTLQLYIRKTDDPSAILDVLEDPEDGGAGLPVPVS